MPTLAGALLLTLTLSQSLSPSAGPADLQRYETFLRQAAVWREEPAPVPIALLNGEPAPNGITFKPVGLNLRNIGIKDTEIVTLMAVALEYVAEGAKFDVAMRELTLEARLTSIDSGSPPAAIAAAFQEKERQRQKMVAQFVGKLRVALGELSFAKVDAFVHSGTPPK